MKILLALTLAAVLGTGSALAGDGSYKKWRSYYVNGLNTTPLGQRAPFVAFSPDRKQTFPAQRTDTKTRKDKRRKAQ